MARIITMPALGQTVEEQRILQWFKNEGDSVARGEPLAEFETDKVNIEWQSPEDGVVRKILAPVDAFVRISAPILIIGTADEPIDDLLAQTGAAPATLAATSAELTSAASAPAAQITMSVDASTEPLFASPRARRYAEEFGVDLSLLTGRGTGPKGRVQEMDVIAFHREASAAAAQAADAAGRGPKASPLARAVASNEGLDLAAYAGTGPGGRINADDLRHGTAPVSEKSAPPAAVPGGSHTVTLTGLRKRVADNIARSARNAPHVTLHLSVDMSRRR